MFLACLRVYDRYTDSEGLMFTVRFSDVEISEVLGRLENGGAVSITLPSAAVDARGVGRDVCLTWDPTLASFVVRVATQNAGIISHDELKAATGIDVPENGHPCMVCLSGIVDTYRRGILNLHSGRVDVYTCHRGLASFGAHAFLTGIAPEGYDGLRFKLDKGEPAAAPLRVPSHQLRLLKNSPLFVPAVPKADPQDAFDQLASISQQVHAFQRTKRLT